MRTWEEAMAELTALMELRPGSTLVLHRDDIEWAAHMTVVLREGDANNGVPRLNFHAGSCEADKALDWLATKVKEAFS